MFENPKDHQEPDPAEQAIEDIDDDDGRTTCGLLEED